MPAPAKETFRIHLHKMGVLALDAAELLARILADPSSNSKKLAPQVREIADECKRLARSLVEGLDRALVKPLDQDVLRKASQALDGMVSLLEQVSSNLALFQEQDSIPFTARIAEVIFEQSRGITAALSGMRNGGLSLKDCEDIIRPKEEVDRLHDSSLFYLFEAVSDPIEVVKRKQIIDDLKQVSKDARDVGYALKPLTYSRLRVH